jgi:hypothetical protein
VFNTGLAKENTVEGKTGSNSGREQKRNAISNSDEEVSVLEKRVNLEELNRWNLHRQKIFKRERTTLFLSQSALFLSFRVLAKVNLDSAKASLQHVDDSQVNLMKLREVLQVIKRPVLFRLLHPSLSLIADGIGSELNAGSVRNTIRRSDLS